MEKKLKNGIIQSTIIINGKEVPYLKIPPRMSGLDVASQTLKKRKPSRTKVIEESIFEDDNDMDIEDLKTKLEIKDALDNYCNTGEISDEIEAFVDPTEYWDFHADHLFDNY